MSRTVKEKVMRCVFLFLSFAFLFTSAGCRKQTRYPGYPCKVGDIIERIMDEGVKNPPQKIYQYSYNGQAVYYVTPYCCDNPSELYNCKGNIICHPDGGFSGEGDGRCKDFFDKRTDEKLIWEDTRK